jgi:phosphoribosylanthranilate isomerase
MILKICGITNAIDADAAIEAGGNAIGFNFFPHSPRYIEPQRAAGIPTAAGVRRVGVFVNETRQRVEEIARIARLDVAQLHGNEEPDAYPADLAVWKAVRVSEGLDWVQYGTCPAEALLLDGPANGLTFDWRVVGKQERRIIVAGGLDASNVALAVRTARPWGVDACSRIESAPGKKDHRKMIQFLQAAKAALAQ